jgi:lipid-binding SYLF domain-containing protein
MMRFLVFSFSSFWMIFFAPIFLQAEVERQEAKLLLASSVLEEINKAPDQAIPSNLLKNCSAVGIFPSLKKGGYIVGAQFGKGVFIHRDPKSKEWSPPVFFKIIGGTLGLQFGFQEMDLILIFTTEQSFQNLLAQGLAVGVSVAATAGPLGRDLSRTNSLRDRDAIYSYSRSQGLFIGATLGAIKIAYDYPMTKKFYGDAYSAEMILLENQILENIPNAAKRFLEIVNRYTNT